MSAWKESARYPERVRGSIMREEMKSKRRTMDVAEERGISRKSERKDVVSV
jgi:hypothetical protein